MKLSHGQQCVLTLLRGGWELRHMDGVGETVDGWYVVNVAACESIDISTYTGNALRRKGLITKVHTEDSLSVTTWKETSCMTRSTGTFSRYAFALLHRVLPGLERRRLKRERTQLLRLAVEQDRLHREQLRKDNWKDEL